MKIEIGNTFWLQAVRVAYSIWNSEAETKKFNYWNFQPHAELSSSKIKADNSVLKLEFTLSYTGFHLIFFRFWMAIGSGRQRVVKDPNSDDLPYYKYTWTRHLIIINIEVEEHPILLQRIEQTTISYYA